MPDERIQRVTMPKWGLSMTTGKIVEWFVSPGEEISKGDPSPTSLSDTPCPGRSSAIVVWDSASGCCTNSHEFLSPP